MQSGGRLGRFCWWRRRAVARRRRLDIDRPQLLEPRPLDHVRRHQEEESLRHRGSGEEIGATAAASDPAAGACIDQRVSIAASLADRDQVDVEEGSALAAVDAHGRAAGNHPPDSSGPNRPDPLTPRHKTYLCYDTAIEKSF